MASEIAELEKLFHRELLGIPAAVACFGAKLSNGAAPANAKFPYAVFQAIPLRDNFGQARTSIQSVFFVDFKIYSRLPLPDTVDAAVAAVKEYFRTANTFTTDNFRVSIRHEMPLSKPEKGAKPDEKLLMRGSTYKVWMSAL